MKKLIFSLFLVLILSSCSGIGKGKKTPLSSNEINRANLQGCCSSHGGVAGYFKNSKQVYCEDGWEGLSCYYDD